MRRGVDQVRAILGAVATLPAVLAAQTPPSAAWVEIVYVGDFFAADGAVRQGAGYLDNLDLKLFFDAGRALMLRAMCVVAYLGLPLRVLAQTPPPDEALRHSVEQLRHAVGCWDVQTAFLNPDGTAARTVSGTYRFSWIVADRVLTGRSDIPELERAAGILFYIDAAARHIAMASVGADGKLWIMTGPLGGEERLSQEYPMAGGRSGRLRFTRAHVTSDAFESRMAYTEDGGGTWKPGNHQTFRRMPCPEPTREP